MSKIHIYKNEVMKMIKVHSYIHLYIWAIQLQPIQLHNYNRFIQMAEEEIQALVQQYRERMEEIAENQSCLPVRYLQEAEFIIRTEIMQSIKSADILPTLQKAMIQWKNELYTRNHNAISKWCKELLIDCTNAIDKKIGRQIKSFNTYRQEIQMTIELLRKKTDVYMSVELSATIYQFIIQKVIQNTLQLNTITLSQIQEQFKIIQIENKALLVQCKENKRRAAKEDNELQRVIVELKQSLRNLQTKYDMLQQSSEELKREVQASQFNKQEKHQKMIQQSSRQLAQLKQRLQKSRDQCQQAVKKYTFLDMQLKKEQLLHKQTMLHYQELVESYHNKQEELKEEILQVSRVSEKEIDQFKILSSKKLEDWQQTATELEQQLQENQQILKQKDKQINALRQQLISEKGKARLISTNLSNQIMELQLKNRVLQEKQTQYQQLKTRFLKTEVEAKKLQKDKQHLNELCKQYEKEKLISQQKYQYLKAQLQQQQDKNHILSQQLLKKEGEIIQKKSLRQRPQSLSTEVQTQVGYQQKIKQALRMMRQIEGEYQKLKSLNQRNKRRF